MEKISNEIQKRMEELRGKVAGFDVVCRGTLMVRRFACGKSNCRCAKGRRWHHGPYYNWTRMENKKLVHKRLTETQAQVVKQAIENYRAILEILHEWESETIKLLETQD